MQSVAILTHRTSFLANNVSTTIARYSLEWPVNLQSASWFVSELTVSEWTVSKLSCQRVGLSATNSELTASELVCQRVDVSASWFVNELVCQRVDCQRVDVSASWFVSEFTVSELICQRDVCEATLNLFHSGNRNSKRNAKYTTLVCKAVYRFSPWWSLSLLGAGENFAKIIHFWIFSFTNKPHTLDVAWRHFRCKHS